MTPILLAEILKIGVPLATELIKYIVEAQERFNSGEGEQKALYVNKKISDYLLVKYETYREFKVLLDSAVALIKGKTPLPTVETKTEGIKHDDGKLRMDLVPISLENAIAEVLTYGAKKYGDRNWEKGLQWSRCYAALRRHLMVWQSREDIDAESGLPHLYHVLANIAFLIEFSKTHPELDDRPTGGK